MSLYVRHRHKARPPVSLSSGSDDHQIHDFLPMHPDSSAPAGPSPAQDPVPPGPRMSHVVVSRKRRPRGEFTNMRAIGLAGQIGYVIAIPAVLFGFGGAYLDKYFDISPAFMSVGLLIAFGSSVMAVKKMIDQLNAETEEMEGKKKE